jgi:hypothetical protein
VIECLKTMAARGLRAVEPRREAMVAYNRRLDARLEGTVWRSGCHSPYFDEAGRVSAIWPDFMHRFRAETKRFDPAEYLLYEADADDAPEAATVVAGG